jgi:hypothetical protein
MPLIVVDHVHRTYMSPRAFGAQDLDRFVIATADCLTLVWYAGDEMIPGSLA